MRFSAIAQSIALLADGVDHRSRHASGAGSASETAAAAAASVREETTACLEGAVARMRALLHTINDAEQERRMQRLGDPLALLPEELLNRVLAEGSVEHGGEGAVRADRKSVV